jgi:F-type H+-transporting ATPase subunit gamma
MLRAQLTSIEELRGVVTAMRSLAATQVQNADRALPGIRRYAQIVGAAVARACTLVAEPSSAEERSSLPPRLLVVCAERGFAGTFNERLVERAAAEPEAAHGRLWIVGARGSTHARARGLAVEWSSSMPSHAAGVFEKARQVATELEKRVARGQLDHFAVLGTVRAKGAGPSIERIQLLPLALATAPSEAAPRERPLHHLPAFELIARAVGEYVAGEVVRVLMESFASENAARMQAMEAARHHIDDKLVTLRDEANRVRQDEITSELLDVIVGSEAVRRRR